MVGRTCTERRPEPACRSSVAWFGKKKDILDHGYVHTQTDSNNNKCRYPLSNFMTDCTQSVVCVCKVVKNVENEVTR